MAFDSNKEFDKARQHLWKIIVSESYTDELRNWVNLQSKSGLSKKEIYSILLLFFSDIQKTDDPGDKLYDRLADFADGFTSWAKGERILPDEPDL